MHFIPIFFQSSEDQIFDKRTTTRRLTSYRYMQGVMAVT